MTERPRTVRSWPYAGWPGRRQRTGRGAQQFTRLSRTDRDALLSEAAQLRAFVGLPPEHDIILDQPTDA